MSANSRFPGSRRHGVPLLPSLAARLMAIACLFIMAGCQRPLYYWGDSDTGTYEDFLSCQYIENNPAEAYRKMEAIVGASDRDKTLMPAPGLYAEYGFMLYQRGDSDLAVEYFKKEAESFPESADLMNKLIVRVRERSSRQGRSHDAASPQTEATASPITTKPPPAGAGQAN